MSRGVSASDFPLIVAWKVGAVDHQAWCGAGAVRYKNEFQRPNFSFKGLYGTGNAGAAITYCQNNLTGLQKLAQTQQYCLLLNKLIEDLAGRRNGFGLTYCITLLYFFTQGAWPIYDQFAHRALNAILSGASPEEVVPRWWKDTQKDYCSGQFVHHMQIVFGRKNLPRCIDRALWVYGHFFKKPGHEELAQAFQNQAGRNFQTAEIIAHVPEVNPPDHARKNKEGTQCWCVDTDCQIFDQEVKRGRYKVRNLKLECPH